MYADVYTGLEARRQPPPVPYLESWSSRWLWTSSCPAWHWTQVLCKAVHTYCWPWKSKRAPWTSVLRYRKLGSRCPSVSQHSRGPCGKIAASPRLVRGHPSSKQTAVTTGTQTDSSKPKQTEENHGCPAIPESGMSAVKHVSLSFVSMGDCVC